MTAKTDATGNSNSVDLSDGVLYKRFPAPVASHEELVDWINLMVQWRGESYQIPRHLDDSDDPNQGMRYLIGADLYTLSEQEMEGILPAAWPQRLRMLVSKDVQRFIARKKYDAKKATERRENTIFFIVFSAIILFVALAVMHAK